MHKVRVLISLRFAANMWNAGGGYGTAVEVALINGSVGLVKLLLEYGADPNAQRTSFEILRICS